jgi:hypothetical protein
MNSNLSPQAAWRRCTNTASRASPPRSTARVFWKQIVAGIFIVLTMTGMDQEMMQKTISVKTLRDSQKNLLSLTAVLVVVLSCLPVPRRPAVPVRARGGRDGHRRQDLPGRGHGALAGAVQIIFLIAWSRPCSPAPTAPSPR